MQRAHKNILLHYLCYFVKRIKQSACIVALGILCQTMSGRRQKSVAPMNPQTLTPLMLRRTAPHRRQRGPSQGTVLIGNKKVCSKDGYMHRKKAIRRHVTSDAWGWGGHPSTHAHYHIICSMSGNMSVVQRVDNSYRITQIISIALIHCIVINLCSGQPYPAFDNSVLDMNGKIITKSL